jgi:hypothetical protein
MSTKLILINGLGGVGKTTCARILCERIDSFAYFDFDMLTKVKPFEFGEKLIRLGLKNSAGLIDNFCRAGYQTVIMSGGIYNQEHVDYIKNRISEPEQIFLFWLVASKGERDKRRIDRSRDKADDLVFLDLVDEKIAQIAKPMEKGIRYEIYTDGFSPNEIVENICRIISESEGQIF